MNRHWMGGVRCSILVVLKGLTSSRKAVAQNRTYSEANDKPLVVEKIYRPEKDRKTILAQRRRARILVNKMKSENDSAPSR